MEKLFDLFKMMLEIHIKTKTTCPLFHEKTEKPYELLFDCFHKIAEKRQDVGMDEPITDEEEAKEMAYEYVEKAKMIVGDLIKEDNTYGMDNLLRGLYDQLEFECGNLRGFVMEEESEEEEEGKEPDDGRPAPQMRKGNPLSRKLY